MKTCTTIVQSLSLPTLCLEIKKCKIINIALYISKFTMNTQWPHNNKIQSWLSASLVAQKIALKTKISIHITSNAFRFDMT